MDWPNYIGRKKTEKEKERDAFGITECEVKCKHSYSPKLGQREIVSE